VRGRAGGGADAMASGGAALPRRWLVGERQIGVPGGNSSRGLAREHPLGMRSPPVRSEQWIGARGVVLDGDGGVERRNIARVRRAGN